VAKVRRITARILSATPVADSSAMLYREGCAMEDKSFMVREGPEDHSESANIVVHGLDNDGDPLCG